MTILELPGAEDLFFRVGGLFSEVYFIFPWRKSARNGGKIKKRRGFSSIAFSLALGRPEMIAWLIVSALFWVVLRRFPKRKWTPIPIMKWLSSSPTWSSKMLIFAGQSSPWRYETGPSSPIFIAVFECFYLSQCFIQIKVPAITQTTQIDATVFYRIPKGFALWDAAVRSSKMILKVDVDETILRRSYQFLF